MESIPRASAKQGVFSTLSNSLEKEIVMRGKRMLVNRIMGLVSMFQNVQEIVQAIYAGIPVATKTRLQMPEYYRLVDCENDFACLQDALLSIVKINATPVLNLQSDIIGGKKAV